MKILIDTSILIDFSRSQQGVYLDLVKRAKTSHAVLCTSVLVKYEFYAGKSLSKSSEMERAKLLFQDLLLLPVNDIIATEAASFVRKDLCPKFDALIAATAIVEGAQLATLNTKHFQNIPNLQLFSAK